MTQQTLPNMLYRTRPLPLYLTCSTTGVLLPLYLTCSTTGVLLPLYLTCSTAGVLLPLYRVLEAGAVTANEQGFVTAYGAELQARALHVLCAACALRVRCVRALRVRCVCALRVRCIRAPCVRTAGGARALPRVLAHGPGGGAAARVGELLRGSQASRAGAARFEDVTALLGVSAAAAGGEGRGFRFSESEWVGKRWVVSGKW